MVEIVSDRVTRSLVHTKYDRTYKHSRKYRAPLFSYDEFLNMNRL